MAARVAARLKKRGDVDVETRRGGLGELSVDIDGQKVIDTNRFWYPATSNVVKKIEALLEN